LNHTRFDDPADERFWLDLPQLLRLKIPQQYLDFLDGGDISTPVKLLETLMGKTTSGMIEEAVLLMKHQMATIANDGFHSLARYARDMIVIDRMSNFKQLAPWVNMTVDLETIKARLSEIATLDIERRRLLNTFDTDFVSMCNRISRCNLSGKPLQLNTINVGYDPSWNSKNGPGLAEARQNWYPNRSFKGGKGNRFLGKGKGKGKGKGFKGGKGFNGKGYRFQKQSWMCTLPQCSSDPHHAMNQCPTRANRRCGLPQCAQELDHAGRDCPVSPIIPMHSNGFRNQRYNGKGGFNQHRWNGEGEGRRFTQNFNRGQNQYQPRRFNQQGKGPDTGDLHEPVELEPRQAPHNSPSSSSSSSSSNVIEQPHQ
jgi:hypothetical protein